MRNKTRFSILCGVCILAICLISAAFGQSISGTSVGQSLSATAHPAFVFTKSVQTLDTLRTFAVDFGDVDRDGDNDVFIGSYHYYWVAPSRLWLNNGDGTFSLSPQSFPVSDGHGVAIRDFNGDTYLDIFLLSNSGPSRVFYGDGSGSFTMGSQNIGDGADLPFAMKTGDIDNDGDLDVVTGTMVGVRIWLNDGTGVFTLTGALCEGRAGATGLADVNGDTYLDLFIVLSNAPDEVWLNDGTGSFVNSGQALGPSDGFGYATSGDVDGDGDIDFVVGNSVRGVSIWLNQNNTGTFADPGFYLDSGSFRSELFDADLDGDLDLITAYLGASTKVWKNNGAGSFSLVGPILGAPRALAIGPADLDGDGDDDIVLGYDETCGGNPVYFNEQISDRWDTVTDVDGNVYWTIQIGDQVWMAENLKVTHYRNGNPVANITDGVAWASQTGGAYCNYANDTSNAGTYGRLYNWYAAADSRNLAPVGWHVATDTDWQTLIDYLGGTAVAGWKIKEAGTGHWLAPNSGTNEAGFTALPGGYRGSQYAVFADMGAYATFWTSTPASSTYGWYLSVSYDDPEVSRYESEKYYGLSIRCVQDVKCCAGTTGNVNDGAVEGPDLSDLSLLIAYLVQSPRPTLPCPAEANVNAAGATPDLSDLSLLIAYLTVTPKPPLPNCP